MDVKFTTELSSLYEANAFRQGCFLHIRSHSMGVELSRIKKQFLEAYMLTCNHCGLSQHIASAVTLEHGLDNDLVEWPTEIDLSQPSESK